MLKSSEDRIAVGIDLGTTMSTVAFVDANGTPQTLRNSDGDQLTPSAILFDPAGPIIGKEAVNGAAFSPELYVECFKRRMGKPADIEVNGVSIPNEVLSAFLLERLRSDAESALGNGISEAVVTVPAYFDEVRRQATCQAAELAGINVIEIINEPTAAAIRYGMAAIQSNEAKERIVLVYDLGGGTFDVTILKITPEQFVTMSTEGDVYLGGKDFDQRLVDHLAELFKQEHGLDPRTNPNDHCQLWSDAEEIKKGLSQRDSVKHILYHSGIRLRVEISRNTFEEASIDLLGRTRTTIRLAMQQAGVSWEEINDIILVGGSSRMPMVKKMITETSSKTVHTTVDPDFAVAQGAALYASMFGQNQYQFPSIVNVNSHSMGIEGFDKTKNQRVNSIVIPRNTPIPTRVARKFRTAKPGQRSVKVTILEGENRRPDSCVKVGDCTVRNLPAGLPAGTPVFVELGYDLGGCLTVSAKVPDANQSALTRIERTTEIESRTLDEWEKLICSSIESAHPKVNLRMLDQILSRIGKRCILEDKKKKMELSELQRHIASLRIEIDRLDKQQARNKDKQAAIQIASRLTTKHIEIKRLESRRNLILIVAGRDRVEANPSAPDSDIREAKQIIEQLSGI